MHCNLQKKEMSTVKYFLTGIVRAIVTYSLCVSLNAFICTAFGISYVFSQKVRNRFWKIHQNTTNDNNEQNRVPPKCLSDPKYGEHKFVTVNVSTAIRKNQKIICVFENRLINFCFYVS